MSKKAFIYKVIWTGFYTTSEWVLVVFDKDMVWLIFESVCPLTKNSKIYSKVLEWEATHILKCGCCGDGKSGLIPKDEQIDIEDEEEVQDVVVPDPTGLAWDPDPVDPEAIPDSAVERSYEEQVEFLDELWIKDHRRKDDDSPKTEKSVKKIYDKYK